MRFSHVLSTALLAATSYAADESSSPNASGAAAEDPIPVGALWTAKWDTVALQPYTQHCLNRNTYNAQIYKLSELYPDLEKFAPQLKIFYNKQHYAGSWSGIDEHGNKRDLMRMSLSDMPYKVREWLKRETKQKHFSVQEDNVFFAPGAIYPILPLWVDEPEDADLECENVFDDLENYSNEPKDGKVLGKVTHSAGGKNEVKFTVEALVVKKKGKAPTRKENDEL
ncbi:hypothetical protein FB567DRAFT_608959 [Paraphoma chrysanthemicola]|uniref:Uncharacterized protein n=1 Tax=Paraphoma chrysanthemicola TaxID=798071 RepID=A0A8K0VUV1_9PLEO|nr:hypothetical protein FB567DRAFT_608959 [Paraphoma chrysanthemicola]